MMPGGMDNIDGNGLSARRRPSCLGEGQISLQTSSRLEGPTDVYRQRHRHSDSLVYISIVLHASNISNRRAREVVEYKMLADETLRFELQGGPLQPGSSGPSWPPPRRP